MQLAPIDWVLIAAYLIFAMAIGLYFQRRAGASVRDYFLSGRSLPWWIAGTSMVATTFAADTPLAITGIVARQGIAGNWIWWNLALSHMVATIFFARLWSRAGVITDLELVDIRYSGREARVLRGFRACWEGVLINSIIMGWVILAMVKLFGVLFDLDRLTAAVGLDGVVDGRWLAIMLCLAIALAYTVLSGFWGVVMTDLVQFSIAMLGSIVLAVFAWRDIGGAAMLRQRLAGELGEASHAVLAFLPVGGGHSLPLTSFVAFLTVNWWATRQIDGGNFLTQRMLAAKDERHSFLASLWFTVAHYVLRPWPWILVALVALVVFPGLDDPELAYPKMILAYLPAGWLGLMVASFLAAFMSTVDSHLNWGTALLVNDFYRPFVAPGRDETHYVLVARLLSVLLMVCGGTVAYLMTSVVGGWQLFYGLTAGIGGVYLGRWLWWRVSAWSEIAAWTASAATYLVLSAGWPETGFGSRLIVTTLVSTGCWVVVTLVAPPSDEQKLVAFFERVRPGSPWWGPIEAKSRVEARPWGRSDLLAWLGGVTFVFAALFALGKLLLFGWLASLPYTALAVVAGWSIHSLLGRG